MTTFNTRRPAAKLPVGQCILQRSSATALILNRRKGRFLFINGEQYEVPAAGVTVDNSGLSADTTYFVYASIVAGAVALDLFTTTPAPSAAYGHMIRGTDGIRSLVGMIRTSGSSQFVDGGQFRFVRSWFNDRGVNGFALLNGDKTTSSGSYVELDSAARAGFLVWANEVVTGHFGAMASNDTAGDGAFAAYAFDGSAVTDYRAVGKDANTPVNIAGPAPPPVFSQGYHYASLFGATNAGVATFYAQSYIAVITGGNGGI